MPDAVIVSATRTPIGRAGKGSLVEMRPDDLTALVVRSALDRAGVPIEEVEDLIVGCGLPGGEQGYNIARVVAVLLGRRELPGTTVTRFCASSLQAIRMAAHAIRAGEGDVFVAAGVETVSRYAFGTADSFRPKTDNPKFDEAKARSAARLASGSTWAPETEGLPDIFISMGETAENVADITGVTRAEMDQFALRSHQRALESQANGFFEREITPVERPDGVLARTDDGPRPSTNLEALGALQPVFRPGGRVTAGNSCPLNDGAAAVVLMSDRRARELGITPLARVVSSAVTGIDPEIMGLGPVDACRAALRRAGMQPGDVDLVEINEAFAAQVIPSARQIGFDLERVNVHGGGIALGHPFGMTGARIMTTLLNGLQHTNGTIGIESMCVGAGQGMAMVVERLS